LRPGDQSVESAHDRPSGLLAGELLCAGGVGLRQRCLHPAGELVVEPWRECGCDQPVLQRQFAVPADSGR
jgi:hypothetical protein